MRYVIHIKHVLNPTNSKHHPDDMLPGSIRRDEFNERNKVYGFVNTEHASRKPAYEYTTDFKESLKACVNTIAYVLDRYVHDMVS